MDQYTIKSAIQDLIGIQHILLHMASSEYLINSPDSEVCRVLSENIDRIRESLQQAME